MQSSKHVNGPVVKKIIENVFPDKKVAREVSEATSYVYDQGARLFSNGADLSVKTFQFLKKNWKPTLAVTSVAAAAYMIHRVRKNRAPVQLLKSGVKQSAKTLAKHGVH